MADPGPSNAAFLGPSQSLANPTNRPPARTESPLPIINEPPKVRGQENVPFPNSTTDYIYHQRQQNAQDRVEEARRALEDAEHAERQLVAEAEARFLDATGVQRYADESRVAVRGAQQAVSSELRQHAADVQQAVFDAENNVASQTQRHITDTHKIVIDAENDVASQTTRHISETQQAAIDAQRAVAAEAQQHATAAHQAVVNTKNDVANYARTHITAAQNFLGGAQHFMSGFVDGARKSYTEHRGQIVHPVRTPEDETQQHLTNRAIRRDSNNSRPGLMPPPEAYTRSPARNPEPLLSSPSSAPKPLPSPAPTATFSSRAFAAVSPVFGQGDAERPQDPYRKLSLHRSSTRPPDPYNRWSSFRRDPEASQATLTPGARVPSDGSNVQPSSEHGEALMPESVTTPIAHRRPSTLVGSEEPKQKQLTVAERLQPMVEYAYYERDKCKRKAHRTGLLINLAIGLQVFFGALTTGLSAVLSGRKAGIVTTIFGGITTMLASYLARTRGSGDPELSRNRARDLENFLRDVDVVITDRGYQYSRPSWRDGEAQYPDENSRIIEELRKRLEAVMGDAYQASYATETVSHGRPRGRSEA